MKEGEGTTAASRDLLTAAAATATAAATEVVMAAAAAEAAMAAAAAEAAPAVAMAATETEPAEAAEVDVQAHSLYTLAKPAHQPTTCSHMQIVITQPHIRLRTGASGAQEGRDHSD